MTNKNKTYKPPCEECKGRCCEYIAIEIDTPTTKNEFDYIRWYLVHENTNVFIDHDKKWHVEFRTTCQRLNDDNKCTMYRSRPKICKNYGMEDEVCEYFASPYLKYFETTEQFQRFLNKKDIEWRFKK